jgi:TM2 domain-containing membrane protein YozV
MVVAICAILLGSLGVHRFLLGNTKEGIITLCVSFLTCGLGAVVMQVIGIVEGIKYLQMSDQDFQQTYVISKKPWF